MGIFSKKSALKAPLTYVHIIFNLTQIRSWRRNPRLIEPVERWDRNDEVKDLLITLLPGEEFLFHHQEINQFSPSMGGYLNFDEADPVQLEWNSSNNYFYVLDDSCAESREIIFLAPMDEIAHLLANKCVKSKNLKKDCTEGGLIQITGEWKSDYCKEIFRRSILQDDLCFRNELIEFSAVNVGARNQVQYRA